MTKSVGEKLTEITIDVQRELIEATGKFGAEKLTEITIDVQRELIEATGKFGAFASAHEGYAVILEELDELWHEVRHKTGTRESQYAAAKQVAAMAMRFMLDICGGRP